MKKLFAAIICILLVITACLPLISCGQKTTNPIKFGEKYVKDKSSYVFNSDGTGVYTAYHSIEKINHTTSGTAEFEWREASDGAIYLFQTDVKYNADNSDDATINVTSRPIYFGKDFFVYTTDTGAVRFIIEDSKLDELVND